MDGKLCTCCYECKTIEAYYRSSAPTYATQQGRIPWCKECVLAYQRDRRRKKRLVGLGLPSAFKVEFE